MTPICKIILITGLLSCGSVEPQLTYDSMLPAAPPIQSITPIRPEKVKKKSIRKPSKKKKKLLQKPTIQKDLKGKEKVAAEHGIQLKKQDLPLIDTHGDRALHGNYKGRLAKPFNSLVKLFAPYWGPHISEENLIQRAQGAQVMSVPTDGLPPLFYHSQGLYTTQVVGRPGVATNTRLNRVIAQTAFTYRLANNHPDNLVIAKTYKDVIQAINNYQVALMPAIEGAQFLVPRGGYNKYSDYQKKLKKFIAHEQADIPSAYPLPSHEELQSIDGILKWSQRLGVLYIGLNHLGSNRFAGSDLKPGSGKGFTSEGKEAIRMMQKYGILLDLAHASQNAQSQLKSLKLELPILVSHGIVATPGEKPDWRDTRPEVLDEIKRTRGVFGVMFASQYLKNGTIEDVVEQFKHVRAQIGIEHLAIGTDADGFVNLVIEDMGAMGQVLDALSRAGFSEEDIARITFGNFLNMLKQRDQILANRNG